MSDNEFPPQPQPQPPELPTASAPGAPSAAPPPMGRAPYPPRPQPQPQPYGGSYGRHPYGQGGAPPPFTSGPAPYPQGDDQRRRRLESRAKRTIGIGVLLLVAGLLVTVFTYANAQGGGVYVVAWGPVAFGLFRIVAGIAMLGRARR